MSAMLERPAKQAVEDDDKDPMGLAAWLATWHIDAVLLVLIGAVLTIGFFVLYSATGEQSADLVSQAKRVAVGLTVMVLVAQAPPSGLRSIAPFLYAVGVVMLLLVIVIGTQAKGAQRWLDLGVVRFQPSEMMKLALPMMLAAYLHFKPLPPSFKTVMICAIMIAVPVGLVAIQPDLGTSLMIAVAGAFTVYFAGLSWRLILGLLAAGAAAMPVLWHFMQPYQRGRVLTLIDPSRDPGGAGYQIAQSEVAVGSGGLFGKGWLDGTQAKLHFLPESNTDFIFSVYAEEMGFMGVLLLLTLYSAIVIRGLIIAVRAQDSFSRLLAGSLSLTFFVYVFVNIGMVVGLLPVVGVPLPLVSYGGTSMVSLLAGMGILMSIQTHRRLLAS